MAEGAPCREKEADIDVSDRDQCSFRTGSCSRSSGKGTTLVVPLRHSTWCRALAPEVGYSSHDIASRKDNPQRLKGRHSTIPAGKTEVVPFP
jgi:hypothetical protein